MSAPSVVGWKPPRIVDQLWQHVSLSCARRGGDLKVRGSDPWIGAPPLLIYGGREERAPLYVANQLHEAIPGSTLVVLPEAGHVCSVEAPGEFNREISAFVTKHAKQTA